MQFVDFNVSKRLVRIEIKSETKYLSEKNEPEEDKDFTTESSSVHESSQSESNEEHLLDVSMVNDV